MILISKEQKKAFPWMKTRSTLSFSFHTDKEICKKAIIWYMGQADETIEPFQWLPEYDEIADWMTDTKGKGLFLTGDVGRGKSVLLKHVFPTMFLRHKNKVLRPYHCDTFHENIKEIMSRQMLVLDDVGAESVVNEYGKKYYPFIEIMHQAESDLKFLLISSNLNKEEINAKYGVRILDRIENLCKIVVFKGPSLRSKQ